MPAIDFPASPSVNDEYSFEGRTWLWNGTGWEVKSYPAALQLGSASAPSLYFTGDPNTGLYSPGADQVALSTGGTRRLNIDSSGNLVVDTGDATIYGVRVGRGNSARADNTVVGKNALSANTTGDYSVAIGSGALQSNQGGISNVAVGLSALNANVSGNYNTGIGTESLLANTGSSNICIGNNAGKALTTGSNNTIIGEIQGTAGLSNTVIIGAGSTERLRITGDGKVGVGTSSPDALLTVNGVGAFGAGSASAPSIAATGDLNTGMYFPGADQVAISTGGTGRLFVDASGQCTIDSGAVAYSLTLTTTNPYGTTLQFADTSAPFASLGGAGTTIPGTNKNDFGINYNQTNASRNLIIASNGTERLRITSDGKVGIGTSSPGNLLTVTGAATNVALAYFVGTDAADSNGILVKAGGANAGKYIGTFQDAAGNTRLHILADGKVGIGTSSPQGNLHIVGSSATPGVGNINISNAAYPTSGWAFRIPDSGSVIDLSLDGAIGGVWRSVMYFDRSAGNVGIGTSSPGYLLDVNGQVKITTNSINDSYFGFGANFDNYFTCGASGEQIFRSYNAERARIDSSGRLLVGTSTARTNFSEITTIDGNVALVNDDTYSTSLTRGIAYYSSTSSFGIQPIANIYFATEGDAQSSLRFHTRSSPGDYAERVRIDSSGRLLVGTSSATTAARPFLGTSTPVTPISQIEGYQIYTDEASRCFMLRGNSALDIYPYFALVRSKGTALGSNTTVANGDNIGALSFQGTDGTNSVEAASIVASVDGTPGANDMPGRLVFSTTADGASSPTEAFRITNDRVRCYNQAAPAAIDTTATLTVANLKTGIITSTTAAAVTMTLPTGTDTEAGFSGIYTNMTFEWSVINTGATNAVTVQGGTGHTLVGSGTVAASNSGRFASRRTASNTFVTYRLSG